AGELRAHTWVLLGIVASNRARIDEAEELWTKALAVDQQVHPEGARVARDLQNLAGIAMARGDLAGSDDMLRRAQRIFQRLSPGSLRVVSLLLLLGSNAFDRHDLDEADHFLTQALEVNPEYVTSLAGVTAYRGRGEVAVARRDWKAARAFYTQAEEILKKV